MTQFFIIDHDGSVVPAPDGMIFNDLTRARRFEEMPQEGDIYIPIIIHTEEGRPWLAMIAPTVLLTMDEVSGEIVRVVAEAREDLVRRNDELNERQNAMLAQLDADGDDLLSLAREQASAIDMLRAHDAILDDRAVRISEIVQGQDVMLASLQAMSIDQSQQSSRLADLVKDLRLKDTAQDQISADLRAVIVKLEAADKGFEMTDRDLKGLIDGLAEKNLLQDQIDAALKAKDIVIDQAIASLKSAADSLKVATDQLAAKDVVLEQADATIRAANDATKLAIDALKAKDVTLEQADTALRAATDALKAKDAALDASDSALAAVQATQKTLIDNQQVILDQLKARKQPVPLPDVVIPAASLLTLTAGTKTISGLACVGIKPADALSVDPKTLTSGYGLVAYSVTENDKINVTLQCPVLSVGGTAQTVSVVAFR